VHCRTPRLLRRTSSSCEASPRVLRPSLRRASYTGSGSPAAEPPLSRQPSNLRRSSSFPKSHALSRTLSLGDILADREQLDLAQIESSCLDKVQAAPMHSCMKT
jgi:hypothetical protein